MSKIPIQTIPLVFFNYLFISAFCALFSVNVIGQVPIGRSDTASFFYEVQNQIGAKNYQEALVKANQAISKFDCSIFWIQKCWILFNLKEYDDALRNLRNAEARFFQEKNNRIWFLRINRDEYLKDIDITNADEHRLWQYDSLILSIIVDPLFEEKELESLVWAVDSKELTFVYSPIDIIRLKVFCKYNLGDYYGCYNAGKEHLKDVLSMNQESADIAMSYIYLAGAYTGDEGIQKELIREAEDFIKRENLSDDIKGRVFYSLGTSYKNLNSHSYKGQACNYLSSAFEYGIDCLDEIKSYCR